MKPVFPRTRKAYRIPDYIPDEQIYRYIQTKRKLKAGDKFDLDTLMHLQSLDKIGCIS